MIKMDRETIKMKCIKVWKRKTNLKGYFMYTSILDHIYEVSTFDDKDGKYKYRIPDHKTDGLFYAISDEDLEEHFIDIQKMRDEIIDSITDDK